MSSSYYDRLVFQGLGAVASFVGAYGWRMLIGGIVTIFLWVKAGELFAEKDVRDPERYAILEKERRRIRERQQSELQEKAAEAKELHVEEARQKRISELALGESGSTQAKKTPGFGGGYSSGDSGSRYKWGSDRRKKGCGCG